VTVREGALDGEGLAGGNQGLAGEAAANGVDGRFGEGGEVARVRFLTLPSSR